MGNFYANDKCHIISYNKCQNNMSKNKMSGNLEKQEKVHFE